MPNEASGAALALTLTLATLTELTRPRVPRSGVRPVASLHAPSPAAATAAASGIASSAAAAAAVASQAHLPRTGLRPAAAIAPSRPDDQDPKTSLYSYEMMGFGNKLALDWLFGPSATGRSRGYVHELYGYMPFGDGYGGGKVLPPTPRTHPAPPCIRAGSRLRRWAPRRAPRGGGTGRHRGRTSPQTRSRRAAHGCRSVLPLPARQTARRCLWTPSHTNRNDQCCYQL